MAARFQSFVGVDWSGSGRAHDRTAGLAVSEATDESAGPVVWHRRKRSRAELTDWLASRLSPDRPPVCIGLDFAFGFPVGALRDVFDASVWRELPSRINRLFATYETARAVANAINARPKFKGNGPFRTNEDRANARFYLDHGVPYYRLVETFVPQAISQWYMGSGATVAFSTLTGLAALGELLARRDRGEAAFTVHPFEPLRDGLHALVEVYPAIWRADAASSSNEHQRDALRAAIGLRDGGAGIFSVPTVSSLTTLELATRISQEGWIAGVV